MADTNSLIAQGIANLTKLFTPPSGQEYYAYAHAGQLRADEERKRAGIEAIAARNPRMADIIRALGAQGYAHFPQVDLYDRSLQPGVTPQSLDPSVYAVHGNYRTTVAGSRETIAGENQRNAADNATRTNIAGMEIKGRDVNNQRDNQGRVTTTLLAPVGKDSVRYIPPVVAGAYNLPPMQYGTQELDAGKQYVVPGPGGTSTRVDGPPPVLTTDQQAARDLGTLSVEDRLRFLLAKNKLTTQPGPSGGPSMSTVQPAAPPAAYQSRTVLLPDGSQVQGRYDPRSGITTLADGSPLPPKAVVSTTPGITAASPGALTPAANSQIDIQLKDMDLLESSINQVRTLVLQNPAVLGAPGAIRGFLQNALAAGGDVARMFEDSKNRFLQDAARGAVAPEIVHQLLPNGDFDPAISKVDLFMTMLAARAAKMNDPDGKVSVFGLKQARDALGIGNLTSNPRDTLARLEALQETIKTQREVLGKARPGAFKLFPGQPAPVAPPPAAAPAPGAPPAAPAAPAVPPPPPGFRPVQ